MRWGLVKRWNMLYELMALNYYPMSKIQKFPIQIKKLFSINKLVHLYRFASRLTYEIKGFNIVPFKPNSQGWVFIYERSSYTRLNPGERHSKIMSKREMYEIDEEDEDDTEIAKEEDPELESKSESIDESETKITIEAT